MNPIIFNKQKYKKTLAVADKEYIYYDINQVALDYGVDISHLPYSIRVLLESAVRQYDNENITEGHISSIVNWERLQKKVEYPFKPMRVVLQDLTGVASIVDIASMRQAVAELGGDPQAINPANPVDLVIDHSVHVDYFGTEDALDKNMLVEFERNGERYKFVKWATKAFDNFHAVPPATGIIHQVNIEFLSDVIDAREIDDQLVAFPDSIVGTDSHTTMVNGLGVLGWGVGGIEAEAGMMGEASYAPMPEVIGVKLIGQLDKTVNATDLALSITELLRNNNVVGKFVEYFGEGFQSLSLADRATIANMAPEYGATCGFFPIDQETLDYLELTNRSTEILNLVDDYSHANQLFYTAETEAHYSQVITLDLTTVETSVAGPKRPQDRMSLNDVGQAFKKSLTAPAGFDGFGLTKDELDHSAEVTVNGQTTTLEHGSVLIAAITSCTNTSNPYVMLSAGLLARNAVKRGLKSKPYVKTSLAPGSKVVTQYLADADLQSYLDKLGFNIAGYGCTTCIGNSGPLNFEIQRAVQQNKIIASAVLSGNRNFEGRIHPAVEANYLASPPLVVAYALAGNTNISWATDPVGYDETEKPVYLKDIWPTDEEVTAYVNKYVTREIFEKTYKNVYNENDVWQEIPAESSELYTWDEESTYIANPPFFENMSKGLPAVHSIRGARVLANFGDSITTDHISPAGAIPRYSPTGRYLTDHNVDFDDFNSYGSRRGNHEVMMRGTLANIRIRNQIAEDKVGGYTTHWPTNEVMSIYDAAMKYKEADTDLVILTGKDYGMGSSRDWAAKGVKLLNVKAVVAESYERIHRANLVMMGIPPLQYLEGDSTESLGLNGSEIIDIHMPDDISIHAIVPVVATKIDGSQIKFDTIVRFDSTADIKYYRHDGILPYVIRKKMAEMA